MKKALLVVSVAALVLGLGGLALAGPFGFGPYGRTAGMQGPGGGTMMGPGMMGGFGHGPMGPGMMGTHPCLEASGAAYGETAKPLTKDEATIILQGYLLRFRNQNLKVGTITEKDAYFEAEIVTKDGSLVQKLLVDKRTGWLRPSF